MGKCYEKNPSGNVNCTELWDTFSEAAQINNNEVNDNDYSSFFEVADFSTPKNGILFWSGNQVLIIIIIIIIKGINK